MKVPSETPKLLSSVRSRKKGRYLWRLPTVVKSYNCEVEYFT